MDNRKELALKFVRFDRAFKNLLPYIALFIGLLLLLRLNTLSSRIADTTKNTNDKVEMALPASYPIKFDTPQNVLREPPIFHLDETVDVEARFLNQTDQPITLQADVHYILVTDNKEQIEPIETGLFLTLKPGCTKIPFSNKRPDAVAILTKKLFAQGHKKVTWKITGHNQIIAPQQGGRQQFETDEFSYVPDDTPIPGNRIEHIDDTCDNLARVE